MISGEAHTWFGERLEEHVIVGAGELFYIPAGMPHLPTNLGDQPCVAVIARTDANEQESVVLLPELEPWSTRARSRCPPDDRGGQTPIGMFSAERSTGCGLVSAFHEASAC